MAPRQRQAARAAEAEEEEIFTDLTTGDPDPENVENPAADRRGGVVLPEDSEISDADLEIEDPEEEDPEVDPAEEEEDPEADPEADPEIDPEVEPEPQPDPNAGADDFDPKDVQILALRAHNLEGRKNSVKEAFTRAEADVAGAKLEMKRAKEAGDSDADVAATERYAAAIQAKSRAEDELRGITTEEQGLVREAHALHAKAPKDEKGNPILTARAKRDVVAPKTEAGSKLFPKWSKNNAWFNNAKYTKQKDRLLAIDRGLNAEKLYGINDPRYYAELGTRFNREFPGLFKNLDGKVIATGQRRRGAGERPPGAAGGGRDGGTPERVEGNASKVKLTADDLRQMPQYGFDPEIKEHRKNWLIEKRQQARADANNRRG